VEELPSGLVVLVELILVFPEESGHVVFAVRDQGRNVKCVPRIVRLLHRLPIFLGHVIGICRRMFLQTVFRSDCFQSLLGFA
jgi:hypothetical protein